MFPFRRNEFKTRMSQESDGKILSLLIEGSEDRKNDNSQKEYPDREIFFLYTFRRALLLLSTGHWDREGDNCGGFEQQEYHTF